jgi:hypothetical protein
MILNPGFLDLYLGPLDLNLIPWELKPGPRDVNSGHWDLNQVACPKHLMPALKTSFESLIIDPLHHNN